MDNKTDYFNKYIPEFKEYLKGCSRDYFQPAKTSGYICPICGSGSGIHGTGITTKDGIHYTCWAGCFVHADIIDIVGLKYNINSYIQKIKMASDELHIDFAISENFCIDNNVINAKSFIDKKVHDTSEKAEEQTDYTEFFNQANKNILKTKYHRGLSLKILNRYNIGYCSKWKHPKAPASVSYSPRLIIPTSKYSYLARFAGDTRNLTDRQKTYAKSKVGKTHLFNATALDNDKPVFVVEGEIDALSIIDVGAEAIALGSTGNYKKLLNMLNNKKYKNKKLLLALDNDDAGQNTTEKIVMGLSSIGISYRVVDIAGKYKDPNECFNHNKAEFVKNIYLAIKK